MLFYIKLSVLNLLLLIVPASLLVYQNNCVGKPMIDEAVSEFLKDPSIYAPNPEAVSQTNKGNRNIASAAWWGFNPKNSTSILQKAIDSGVAVLVVPKMKSDWIVDPIFLRSDLKIVFADGVVIMARKESFRGVADCLFTMRGCKNVHLSGYGATFQMHRTDYTSEVYQIKRSEWRHTLAIFGCDNVTVQGLTFQESGGDGIYIGSGKWRRAGYPKIKKGASLYSSNIQIRDVVCNKSYRQGISIISVDNLLIENTVLRNSDGVNPQAGIDFEPNNPTARLANILIKNSLIENNSGAGILFDTRHLKKNYSAPVSIVFDGVTVKNNKRAEVYLSSKLTLDTAPEGYIYFSDTCNFDMKDVSIGMPPSAKTVLVLDKPENLKTMQEMTSVDVQFNRSNPTLSDSHK